MTTGLVDYAIPDGANIGVVEDAEDDAEDTSDLLLNAGFNPIIIYPSPSIEETLGRIRQSSDAVICDLRLVKKARYSGAEIVARCMDESRPAVLLTTYARYAAAVEKYKSRIPRIIIRGEGSPRAFRTALDLAAGEAAGIYSEERRPCRTLVRVEAVEEGGGDLASVFVPAWSPKDALSISAQHIATSSGIPVRDLPGRRFLADVNIYASSELDIYMDNFEVLTSPPDDWMR